MRVRSKDEIFRQLSGNQAAIRTFGVHRCGLFGSFVNGEQTDDSDVDLLVEFEAGSKSFDNFTGPTCWP